MNVEKPTTKMSQRADPQAVPPEPAEEPDKSQQRCRPDDVVVVVHVETYQCNSSTDGNEYDGVIISSNNELGSSSSLLQAEAAVVDDDDDVITKEADEIISCEEEEDIINGRERLKRHRKEVAGTGRVWNIPEIWGQEELLKDWIDCSAFDSSLVHAGIMSARAALVQQAGTPRNSQRTLT